jgi:hypothetical protein
MRNQFNERFVMKISRSVKLALATGSCLVLAPIVNANPGNGNSSHGMGNSAFGRAQGMNPQIGSGNSSFGEMTSQEAKRKRKAKSRQLETARHTRTKHGNSAFGHQQGDATTRTTGSQNNAFGQRTATQHRSHSHATKSSTRGDTDVSTTTAPGNSAFGHQQGDATTRTTGSQNNAYGKAQSKAAQAKHNGDNDGATGASTPSPGE